MEILKKILEEISMISVKNLRRVGFEPDYKKREKIGKYLQGLWNARDIVEKYMELSCENTDEITRLSQDKKDGLTVMIEETGEARIYDDKYDITIHCESAEEQKLAEQMLKSCRRWIPCSEGLPEKSLNSVLGWDRLRNRCCFVQYWENGWGLESDIAPVDIVAWQPLPEQYKPENE